jgi:chorismate mutase
MLEFEKKIKIFRKKIDKIDNQLIKLLKSRILICIRIGQLKKQMKQPINQPQRNKKIIEKKVYQANRCGINPSFIENLFQLIIEESCNIQKNR